MLDVFCKYQRLVSGCELVYRMGRCMGSGKMGPSVLDVGCKYHCSVSRCERGSLHR